MGILSVAGFWSTPLLLQAWEQLVPLSGRFGYPWVLYGTSRWIGAIVPIWVFSVLRTSGVLIRTPNRLLRLGLYFLALLIGLHGLLLYALCADPMMWVSGNGWEFLLYETPHQASLFLNGVIAINLLTRWFGILWGKGESGTIVLEWSWSADLLGSYFGLLFLALCYGIALHFVLRALWRWHSDVRVNKIAWQWCGVAVFCAVVSSSGHFINPFDPLPFLTHVGVFVVFSFALLLVVRRLIVSEQPTER